MRIRATLAAAALVLSGAAGVVAVAQPASAGCQVNIEVHNLDAVAGTVDWSDSKVKIRNGIYKKLGTTSTVVQAGDTISEDFALTFGCNTDRRYQFNFEQAGNSQTIYVPSSSGWTQDITLHVHLDFP